MLSPILSRALEPLPAAPMGDLKLGLFLQHLEEGPLRALTTRGCELEAGRLEVAETRLGQWQMAESLLQRDTLLNDAERARAEAADACQHFAQELASQQQAAASERKRAEALEGQLGAKAVERSCSQEELKAAKAEAGRFADLLLAKSKDLRDSEVRQAQLSSDLLLQQEALAAERKHSEVLNDQLAHRSAELARSRAELQAKAAELEDQSGKVLMGLAKLKEEESMRVGSERRATALGEALSQAIAERATVVQQQARAASELSAASAELAAAKLGLTEEQKRGESQQSHLRNLEAALASEADKAGQAAGSLEKERAKSLQLSVQVQSLTGAMKAGAQMEEQLRSKVQGLEATLSATSLNVADLSQKAEHLGASLAMTELSREQTERKAEAYKARSDGLEAAHQKLRLDVGGVIGVALPPSPPLMRRPQPEYFTRPTPGLCWTPRSAPHVLRAQVLSCREADVADGSQHPAVFPIEFLGSAGGL